MRYLSCYGPDLLWQRTMVKNVKTFPWITPAPLLPRAVRKVTAALSRLHLSLSCYGTSYKTSLMDGPPHRLAYVYHHAHTASENLSGLGVSTLQVWFKCQLVLLCLCGLSFAWSYLSPFNGTKGNIVKLSQPFQSILFSCENEVLWALRDNMQHSLLVKSLVFLIYFGCSVPLSDICGAL